MNNTSASFINVIAWGDVITEGILKESLMIALHPLLAMV